ncbi:Heat shock 70 kDa protein IV [Orchesella cincta]|uniref:Heat shock 70 kDa protein IV n=1 Tax=Orchesella cincta TaxID=48709 RepID=A0A1D2M1S7_ORCCI|nr:Heat shock 70 kDa protein IV [Orchesella cincta]
MKLQELPKSMWIICMGYDLMLWCAGKHLRILIPFLQKTLRFLQEFLSSELLKIFRGKTLDCSINPDEAVAYGAANESAMLNGSVLEILKNMKNSGCAPMSIEYRSMRRTPVKLKQTYRTALDNQISVHITIYKRNPVAANNEKWRLLFEWYSTRRLALNVMSR